MSTVCGAAAALGGFLLVFLGITTTSLDSFSAEEKGSVTVSHQLISRLSVVGVVSALGSMGASIFSMIENNSSIAWVAIICLASCAFIVTIVAVSHVWSLR